MSEPFTSQLAERLAPELLERFLRYVRVETQSARGREGSPSTPGQLELGRLLVAELAEAGAGGPAQDANGYVTASLPATVEGPVPVICLVAHMDTTPDESGVGVEPIVHRDYGGAPIALPQGTTLDPAELPQLAAARGHDLVTASGDTLLGADDKAGVAAIVTAFAHLAAHPELPRPELRACFTPDEEVGEGATQFDIEGSGADCAYTVDGSELGEVQDETFNAVEMTIEITGVEAHPGWATGRLVNALRLAGRVLAALPGDRLTPEGTSGREGFIHPYELTGSAAKATLRAIVRDFDERLLEAHCDLLRETAERVCAAEPRAQLRIEVRPQYPNMRRYLDEFPMVTAAAEEAIRAEGLEPRRVPIRGGTDGSILSSRGLPTPNLFTGGHDFHSVREWASLPEMAAAAATLVHLAEVWTRPDYSRSFARA